MMTTVLARQFRILALVGLVSTMIGCRPPSPRSQLVVTLTDPTSVGTNGDLVVAERNGQFEIRSNSSYNLVREVKVAEYPMEFAVDHQGHKIAWLGAHNTLAIADLGTGKLLDKITLKSDLPPCPKNKSCEDYPNSTMGSLDFSPDDNLLALGRADGACEIHRVSDLALLDRFQTELPKSPYSLSWFLDGVRWGPDQKTVAVWGGGGGAIMELSKHTRLTEVLPSSVVNVKWRGTTAYALCLDGGLFKLSGFGAWQSVGRANNLQDVKLADIDRSGKFAVFAGNHHIEVLSTDTGKTIQSHPWLRSGEVFKIDGKVVLADSYQHMTLN